MILSPRNKVDAAWTLITQRGEIWLHFPLLQTQSCITETLLSIHDARVGGFFQCHLHCTYEERGALDKPIASSGEQQ